MKRALGLKTKNGLTAKNAEYAKKIDGRGWMIEDRGSRFDA